MYFGTTNIMDPYIKLLAFKRQPSNLNIVKTDGFFYSFTNYWIAGS